MERPTRQRQAATTTETQTTKSSSEQDVEAIDPSTVDPEEVIKTDDGELIHEQTGLVLDDEQIDHGPSGGRSAKLSAMRSLVLVRQ